MQRQPPAWWDLWSMCLYACLCENVLFEVQKLPLPCFSFTPSNPRDTSVSSWVCIHPDAELLLFITCDEDLLAFALAKGGMSTSDYLTCSCKPGRGHQGWEAVLPPVTSALEKAHWSGPCWNSRWGPSEKLLGVLHFTVTGITVNTQTMLLGGVVMSVS